MKKKCEYNPRHKLRWIEEFCDCDLCGEEHSYWFCDACARREERENQAMIKKTCNKVVEITPDMVIGKGIIKKSFRPLIYQALPHGSRPKKKKRFVVVGENGYLRYTKKGEEPIYLVIE